MNWFKENPFLSGLLAVTLLASGTLGYFLYQSWASYGEVVDAYTLAVDKLHKLQNKVPYPSDANLKAVKSGLDDYREKIDGLRAKLSKMELPLDEKVSPQMFQDNLRVAVDGIKEKAAANGVKLPEKFYLGFEKYQAEPPAALAAPHLNREMRVIESFVYRLVDYKVRSINELKRQPLPQEVVVVQSAGNARQQNPVDAKLSQVLLRYPFEISFTAEQSKFRVAFNDLLGSAQFIIVRTMSITNTSPVSPTIAGKSEELASRNPLNPAAAQPDNGIKIIFGREQVEAKLNLEILDFVKQPASKE